jgi:hypothetical protein
LLAWRGYRTAKHTTASYNKDLAPKSIGPKLRNPALK